MSKSCDIHANFSRGCSECQNLNWPSADLRAATLLRKILYSRDVVIPIETDEEIRDLLRNIPAETIPTGIEFHAEMALTQARMAYHIADNEALEMQQGHLASVIEQLEEIQAKIRGQK